ncbi:efflux transporter outer membrane subunit [Pseudomonas poae]|uniref:Efflux transporter, outer membrane factor (OMF) lipoprotein, NodT family n=1 Tax=Pseudomonas poae TaxID=200451 RepID=A0ABY0RCU9_9PSED|nr:efflux transporter outer membrane subunit [Pseudomonas poae]SDN66856.1 efflux transporter, outer membrane factor (OMF) lipoprotein, NodT family [Pseudomonas poae]
MNRDHKIDQLAKAIAIASLLALGGCMVGPDFKRPETGLPQVWKDQDSHELMNEEHVANNWWEQFHDPVLTQLIEQVSTSNLDLKMAAERLSQSKAIFQSVASDRLPSVEGGLSYNRGRSSQKGLADIAGLDGKKNFNVWDTGIDSTWEIDLWGRVKRAVEAADAKVTVAQSDWQAVDLSLRAETASHYIKLRGIQELLEVTEQNLDTARKTVNLTRIKFQQGVATDLDVSEASALLASIQARIPSLEQQAAETMNALSLLTAQPPSSLNPLLADRSQIPSLSGTIAMGVPSKLAQRRPDIRRAEAQLHAATASIGIAKANFYPSITLSGSMGFQANQLSDLGSWSTHQFAFGPSINIPIFEGGKLKAMLKLSEGQQKEAALAYQKTVLSAWHEVDDAVSGLENQQRRERHLEEAVVQSQKALASAQSQYKQGTTDYLNVLSVQNSLLANESDLATSKASKSLAAVRLYKALGGGWNNS